MILVWSGRIFLPERCTNNLMISDSNVNYMFTNLSSCEISWNMIPVLEEFHRQTSMWWSWKQRFKIQVKVGIMIKICLSFILIVYFYERREEIT